MIELVAQAIERLSQSTAGADDVLAIAVAAPYVPPTRLVAAYSGELSVSFWHGSPRTGETPLALVGFGEATRIDGHGPERIAQAAAGACGVFAALREERTREASEAPGPFFLGGLSFRPNAEREPWSAFADASFSLPRWLYVCRGTEAWLWLCVRAERIELDRRVVLGELETLEAAMKSAEQLRQRARASDVPSVVARLDVADRDAFCALVADAIACIHTRATDKIVAVASSRVTFDEPIDAAVVLQRLDEAYPDTTRFAIQRGERVFVGASPERLVARHGRHVDSDALAGTARRGADDATIVRGLLSSSKDRREHALVVESIAAVLAARCSSLDVPEEPRIRTLRNVHHLWTPMRGVLRNGTHVLSLVEALHPTPAVAGTPRDRATAWIAEHEPTSRGWYTGAVGYFDAAGDGEFAVAIRAGLVGKRDAFLYAGAGIVEASDPPAEYAETRAKEAPMLAALGIVP